MNFVSRVVDTVQAAGAWGPVLFIVVYVAACLVFVPGSILTLAAGFVFGIATGTLVASIGSTLGATAAFVLGRTLFRKTVQRRIVRDARFRELDNALGAQGFKVVLLTRLSPFLPFNVLNFVFSVTKVSLRDFLLASWIGMLPGAIVYVYIGAAANSLAQVVNSKKERGWGPDLLFFLGLGATLVLSAILARLARHELRGIDGIAKHPGVRADNPLDQHGT